MKVARGVASKQTYVPTLATISSAAREQGAQLSPSGMASAAEAGYSPLKPSWERVVKLPQSSQQWIKV